MSRPPSPHRAACDHHALASVIKVIDQVGYPAALNPEGITAIKRARISLLFELTAIASLAICDSMDGFESMLARMKAELAAPGSAAASLFGQLETIEDKFNDARTRLYNLIKFMLIRAPSRVSLEADNACFPHGVSLPSGQILWVEDTPEGNATHDKAVELRDAYLLFGLKMGECLREIDLTKDGSPTRAGASEDNFKYFVRRYVFYIYNNPALRECLSQESVWWDAFTDKLAASLSKSCEQDAEKIIGRFIDIERSFEHHRHSAGKGGDVDHRETLARMCMAHYHRLLFWHAFEENEAAKTANQTAFDAMMKHVEEKRIKSPTLLEAVRARSAGECTMWNMTVVGEKIRREDAYVMRKLRAMGAESHRDYDNYFGEDLPVVNLRHPDSVGLYWILSRNGPGRTRFVNPLTTFVDNEECLKEIFRVESEFIRPSEQAEVFDKIRNDFTKQNPDIPDYARKLKRLLVSYHHLSEAERRQLAYEIEDGPFVRVFNHLDVTFNRVFPAEELNHPAKLEISCQYESEAKDGDILSAFLKYKPTGKVIRSESISRNSP